MSSKISIQRVNSNATIVSIGFRTWYFSYSTCVAYAGPEGPDGPNSHHVTIRRDQNYSVTTAKHLSLMGAKDWRKVDDATFESIAAA
jgi:hypothetical protein